MKIFWQLKQLHEAMDYAEQGGQALFIHAWNGPSQYACFNGAPIIGKLFDADANRLTATTRYFGVRRVKIDRLGRRGQHTDLVGGPLERAVRYCIPSISLAVMQPWAFLVVNGFKDIENRPKPLPHHLHNVPVLIHASAKPAFYREEAEDILLDVGANSSKEDFERLGRGNAGVVGVCTFTGFSCDSTSPWAVPGQYHWKIGEAQPLPYMHFRGQLAYGFPCSYDLSLVLPKAVDA